MKQTRRDFLHHGTLALAGAGLAGWMPDEAVARKRRAAPSDRINVGVIGCNGMGWTNLRAHLGIPEVECIALCDVDRNVLERRAAELEALRGAPPALYGDYRALLENPDVDAVIIATPDHWHCRMLVDAVEAGKHAYVEKPLANSIDECRAMVAAVARTGRIVQVGQWQRSGTHYEDAIAMVRSGALGRIRLVKVWAYQGWMRPVPVQPDGDPPLGVDYAMWLGPAPARPFNPNRFHFNFRWFWDYAGGLMTDWGVHEIDIALYAMQATAPVSVMASGGKFAYPDDASETPDTLQAVFEYDGFNMLWEHATGIDGGNYGRTEGIAFIGNLGTLVLNRGGWEVLPETEERDGRRVYKMEALPEQPRRGDYLAFHARNFVEAMQANDPARLKCGVETGSVAAVNAHMGNIAFRTGRKLYWDAARGTFRNDPEANAFLRPTYHNGWTFPEP
ncbi:Gfo/Idh/MocA family oxidoreductase [Rhodocaloribacter litoris]|uniref:Gfo/Idh/MocA family protein n=1 Tax=Rhodocaloribacter litoris TaxID=2558931 RepID=UPI001424135E|nr:Gfo/Idh/MocA family oxidoreductase [Rhodocaloribacter litoris]QXD14647.1 Gfo/Idh/MocA family oxidoreductase [Rhodocaloribacter litoris]